MKTDKEAATIAYSENLHNARQNWDKGQHVGMPQNHKEINAQVQGFEDGWDAGCKHKEESRWIPVSEQPGNLQYVLCHGSGGRFFTSLYMNNKFLCCVNDEFDEAEGVTHWMPLPTPPQTNK